MIQMICEKRHHKGKPDISYPAVFCDVCNERIASAAEGNVYWNPNFDAGKDAFYAAQWPMKFTHKKCCLIGGDKSVDRQNIYWQPLEHFVVFLARNLGLKMKSDSVEIMGRAFG